MGRKRAELLYSKLIACELRDGLVFIAIGSGAHVESGLIPLAMAVELYLQLGVVISQARASSVATMRRSAGGG